MNFTIPSSFRKYVSLITNLIFMKIKNLRKNIGDERNKNFRK